MKIFVVYRAYWYYPFEHFKTFSTKDAAQKCVDELLTQDHVRAHFEEVEVLPF